MSDIRGGLSRVTGPVLVALVCLNCIWFVGNELASAAFSNLGMLETKRALLCEASRRPQGVESWLLALYAGTGAERTNGSATCAFEHLQSAEKHLDRALAKDPHNSRAHVGLGYVYWMRGDYSSAVEAFQRAAASEPAPNQIVRFMLGVMYEAQGCTEEAIKEWRIARDTQPLFRIGAALEDQGQPREAEELYKLILKVNPKAGYAYVLLGDLSVNIDKDFEQAMRWFQSAYELSPTSWTLLFRLGYYAHHLGREDEARRYFAEWTTVRPDSYEAYLWLGRAMVYQADYVEAVGALEAAKALVPRDASTSAADIAFLLGNVYYALERYPEAVNEYQTVLLLNPEHPSADEVRFRLKSLTR